MTPEELHAEITGALKAHDKPRLSILRQVHNEVKNIQINERREVSEADVDAMLKRVIKQTSETLEASQKAANNQERTDLLQTQVNILEGYLPQQIAGDELDALIRQTLSDGGFSAKKDMGAVMKALAEATGGNFDKRAAAQALAQLLS